MPRKYKLTWQAGSESRNGRWRKKYTGKVYYFDGGRGKSDRDAYEAALTAWEATKVEVDAAAPRPHQLDYEHTIAEWEQVLAWSNRHGDQETAGLAFQKLEMLRRRLAAPVLKPLTRDDRFFSQFDLSQNVLPADLLERARSTFAEKSDSLKINFALSAEAIAKYSQELDGSPARIAREIWNDRLSMQQRRAGIKEDSLGAHVEGFVRQKGEGVEAHEITAGRIYALNLHLTYFRD